MILTKTTFKVAMQRPVKKIVSDSERTSRLWLKPGEAVSLLAANRKEAAVLFFCHSMGARYTLTFVGYRVDNDWQPRSRSALQENGPHEPP